MLTIAPASGSDDSSGSSAGIFIAIGVVVFAGIALRVLLPAARRAADASRWSSRREGRRS